VAEVNPAIQKFVDSFGPERVWAQLLIERGDSGFTLRHVEDRSVLPDSLRRLGIADLRKTAIFDTAGDFRPLRTAPDLVRGWICDCKTSQELWRAIQEIYPSSIPDWYAAQQTPIPVTNYREFTHRQSGMYRITQFLTDAQAGQVISACCNPRFCLKRRFWSVGDLPPDSAERKSAIPCLEPCALLLELARKAARIEQEHKLDVQLSRTELESLLSAARVLLKDGEAGKRTGDIASPTNPRRLQLVVEKFGAAVDGSQEED